LNDYTKKQGCSSNMDDTAPVFFGQFTA